MGSHDTLGARFVDAFVSDRVPPGPAHARRQPLSARHAWFRSHFTLSFFREQQRAAGGRKGR